jgi:hypothetical protein
MHSAQDGATKNVRAAHNRLGARRLRVTVRAERARAAGCPQRFTRCVAMWCDAQRRVVERCDAPRRVALPTVMSISPTHLIDYAKTWRGREAPSRQRCCRIVIMFVSDSIRSPSLPSLPTIMPRPAKPSSPTPAHSTRIRTAKEEVKVSEAKDR